MKRVLFLFLFASFAHAGLFGSQIGTIVINQTLTVINASTGNHSALTNLAYADSGHSGFCAVGDSYWKNESYSSAEVDAGFVTLGTEQTVSGGKNFSGYNTLGATNFSYGVNLCTNGGAICELAFNNNYNTTAGVRTTMKTQNYGGGGFAFNIGQPSPSVFNYTVTSGGVPLFNYTFRREYMHSGNGSLAAETGASYSIGLAQSPALQKLYVYSNTGAQTGKIALRADLVSSATSGGFKGIQTYSGINPATASSASFNAIDGYVYTAGGAAHTGNIVANWFQVDHLGLGTVANQYGVFGYNTLSSNGTVTAQHGFATRNIGYTGKVTTWAGVDLLTPSLGGSNVTNAYAINIQNQQPTSSMIRNLSIKNLTRVSNVVTAILSASHLYYTGQNVMITGMNDSSFEGQFAVITIINASAFTYLQTAANAEGRNGYSIINGSIVNRPYAILQQGPHDFVSFGGPIGAGLTPADTDRLAIYNRSPDTANTLRGLKVEQRLENTATRTAGTTAGELYVTTDTNTGNVTGELTGIKGWAGTRVNTGNIIATAATGIAAQVQSAGAANITVGKAFYAIAPAGTGKIATQTAFYADAQWRQNVTTAYSFYAVGVNDTLYQSGNAVFVSNVTPATDGTSYLGTNTTRWKEISAVAVFSGDLVFSDPVDIVDCLPFAVGDPLINKVYKVEAGRTYTMPVKLKNADKPINAACLADSLAARDTKRTTEDKYKASAVTVTKDAKPEKEPVAPPTTPAPPSDLTPKDPKQIEELP